MIYTGYIAQWKTYPEAEVKVRVARPHILSPSKELLHDWKEGKIMWTEYEDRYAEEITSNPEAWNEIKRLTELSKTTDVRLICYEKDRTRCHRNILLWMIIALRHAEDDDLDV